MSALLLLTEEGDLDSTMSRWPSLKPLEARAMPSAMQRRAQALSLKILDDNENAAYTETLALREHCHALPWR